MDDHPRQKYITKFRAEKKIILMEDDQRDSGWMKNRVAIFKFR
jgi:hypothetical protein